MALTMAGLLVSGCRREEVRVYQAPREEEPMSASASGGSTPGPSTGAAAAASSRPAAPWVVPDGWTEQPASGMRVASYKVAASDGRTADVSVVAMQGEAGGELSNVNRWRDQVGLAAIGESELAGSRTPATVGGRTVVYYEMAGEKPVLEGKHRARTLAAILPAGEMTVFFKMTGEEALVAAEKPKFLAWLRSVDTGERGGAASASEAAPAPKPSTEPAEGLPQWTVPAGWKPSGPRPMRLASFEVPDPAGAGDVSVSSLAGDGGGLLANVNRWRGQVGLPAVDEPTLRREAKEVRTADGDVGLLVDLPGGDKRILGAIVPHGGQSWFFKLTASSALVERQRASFESFVRSVKF